METLNGYCQCGCGGKTLQHLSNDSHHGYVKGEYSKFIRGHNCRGFRSKHWRGGRMIDYKGYVLIHSPGHHRTGNKNYVREHILIAEKALGKPLPEGVQVHHHNGNTSDNKTSGNLVICQDQAYHSLLHLRLRAYKACGNAHWRKCCVCHQYDDIENLYLSKKTQQAYHNSCYAKYHKERYRSHSK